MGTKMAAAKKDETLYVRNNRPNSVAFPFDGVRHSLAHRGSRSDSIALPGAAREDMLIGRWLKNGQLEEISKDSYMKLGKRTVDVLPNEFLKRDLRNSKNTDLMLVKNKDDASGTPVDIVPREAVTKTGTISRPEWAGELMTTEEELEVMNYEDERSDYQSKYR